MIIENKIEFRLEYDSNVLYNFNGFKSMDELVMDTLKNKFINKSFNRSIVLEIIKVLNRSSCISIKNSSNGDMYVNVEFMARCLTFSEGEIIVKNTILEIRENGFVVGVTESKNVNTVLKMTPNLKHITKNSIVPVIVSRIEYKNDSNKILLKCIPFDYNITNNSHKYSTIYNSLDCYYKLVKNDRISSTNDDDIPDNVSTISRKKIEWYNKNTFQIIRSEINNLKSAKIDNILKKISISKYETDGKAKNNKLELHDYTDDVVYVGATADLVMYKVDAKDAPENVITIQHNEFLYYILNQKLAFIKMATELSTI